VTSGQRPYDLIVFGATGFTGGMTAEYLVAHAPPELRWAIAGRSQSKLDAVKARLLALGADTAARAAKIGTVVAALDDEASLIAMAASTRVLLTTVGPFIDYGEPVVRACVSQGTDYVDSTGEPHFVQMLLQRYDEDAKARGVRLVSSCGFDSIPADLGVLFTVLQFPAGVPLDIAGYVSVRGTFSGGTERSAIKALSPPPEALMPLPTEAVTPSGRHVRLDKAKVERRADLDGWAGPLETIDGPVVFRSARTLDRYGPDFRYVHHALHPSLGVLVAAFLLFGGVALLVRFAVFRTLFLKLVKAPGQGPTAEQMSRGSFKFHFIARAGDQTIATEVAGGDPGYGETCKMLAESALCLVQDRAALPDRAGVLTPAEAMGELLLARVQRAGLRFRVL
jgi:saccharopine dehydrogenase (NAD+, L-glutamate forming)